ncbi:MAG: lamin tail domain-containing protein [Bacteroidota bacterium]
MLHSRRPPSFLGVLAASALFAADARSQAVRINEIMYAPFGAEPEWVELFSDAVAQVNLRGWLMSDAGVTQHLVSAADACLDPGSFVVLTKDTAALAAVRPAVRGKVIEVAGFPALNNTGDAVRLYNSQGSVIDSVAYLPPWGGAVGGASLERIDAGSPSQNPSNWGSSHDLTGGTPAGENSIARKSLDVRPAQGSTETISSGEVMLSALIRNEGRLPAEGVAATFYDEAASVSGRSLSLIGRIPISASILPGDSALVHCTWASPDPGSHTVLVVTEFPSDQRPANDSLRFATRVPASWNLVVINEIMYEPLEGEPEFLEILNLSRASIGLVGWVMGDGSTSVEIPAGTPSLQPGACMVMAADSGLYLFFPGLRDGTGVWIPRSGMPTLNNDGDRLSLHDPAGVLVDSVAYSPVWHNPAVFDTRGRSLERIVARGESNNASNWTTCAASEGGTPGRRNSTGLMPSPSGALLSCSPNPFSPDNDGRDDATVIHYALPVGVWAVHATVFDARGRTIRHLATSTPGVGQGDLVWDGRDDDRARCRMGIYIVLLEAIEQSSGGKVTAKGVVVLAAKL